MPDSTDVPETSGGAPAPVPDASPAPPGALERLAQRLGEAWHAIEARLEEVLLPSPRSIQGLQLDLGDIEGIGREANRLFLGAFTAQSARHQLGETGILARVEAVTGGPLEVEVDAPQDLLRVVRPDLPAAERVVCEVKAHLVTHPGGPLEDAYLPSRAEREPFPEGKLLAIDWMLVQRPGPPPEGWRPLPSQTRPGLGIGAEVIRVLRRAARTLHCGGVLGTPMHFHNALIYRRLFAFCDPIMEGYFLALMRDLDGLGLREAAWAVEEERVFCAGDGPLVGADSGPVVCAGSGQTVRWRGLPMLYPLTEPYERYLTSKRYQALAAATLSGARFSVRPR